MMVGHAQDSKRKTMHMPAKDIGHEIFQLQSLKPALSTRMHFVGNFETPSNCIDNGLLDQVHEVKNVRLFTT